jgi:hypothetical protein
MDLVTMADKVGALRIITDTIRPDNGQYLRFRCITCERDPARPPEPAAQPTEFVWHGMNPRHENIVWHVPAGSYPYLEYTSGGGCAILPFDLRLWLPHLLHDVRAEWNREFISSRGVAVQVWINRPYNRQIELRGWPNR